MGEPTRPVAEIAPATLRWAVRLLVAEAVALGGLTVFLVYEDLTARPGNRRDAILVTIFAALMAGLLGLLGWALWRRRRWGRSPAIVLQMLLLPIGYYMITGGLPWLGLPVVAVGLCGAGVLLAPSTRAALGLH